MEHSLELIQENFHFIVTGVRAQVEKVHKFVNLPDSELFDKIKNKESYINNLKTVIENDCYGRIHEVRDQYIIVEIDDNVKIRCDKSAILRDPSDLPQAK